MEGCLPRSSLLLAFSEVVSRGFKCSMAPSYVQVPSGCFLLFRARSVQSSLAPCQGCLAILHTSTGSGALNAKLVACFHENAVKLSTVLYMDSLKHHKRRKPNHRVQHSKFWYEQQCMQVLLSIFSDDVQTTLNTSAKTLAFILMCHYIHSDKFIYRSQHCFFQLAWF